MLDLAFFLADLATLLEQGATLSNGDYYATPDGVVKCGGLSFEQLPLEGQAKVNEALTNLLAVGPETVTNWYTDNPGWLQATLDINSGYKIDMVVAMQQLVEHEEAQDDGAT